MVVILVALTIATFLLLNWYWLRSHRKDATTTAQVTPQVIHAHGRGDNTDLLFHPGHTWVRLETDGTATLGVSDVIANMAGRLATVDLPPLGEKMHRDNKAWTLNSVNGRQIAQMMPISGTVIAVNDALRKEPDRLLDDPYGSGWLLRTTIRGLGAALRHLQGGDGVRARMDEIRIRLATRLQPALGHSALDGGTWARAFGDDLDDQQWQQFKDEIISTPEDLLPVMPHTVRIP